jgi:hypothetical protein
VPEIATSPPPARSARPGDLPSPQAARLVPPRWLDVRLVAGVLLVLGAVVVGARVVAAADDTVPVLVATEDLVADRPFTESMVEPRQVRLEEGIDRYLSGAVPDGWVVVKPVGAGELVPRSAVAPGDERADDLRYVTVSVPAAELPAGLAGGDRVDVWVAPPEDAAPAPDAQATRLLDGVTVTTVSGGGGGLGGDASQRPVTLAVTARAGTGGLDDDVARLVAAGRAGLVYLTAVPDSPGAEAPQGDG